MTPGTVIPGTVTPGTVTPGTVTPGTVTPGTVIERRPLQLHELADANRRVADWMEFEGPCQLIATFPQVYRPEARTTRLGAFENTHLISHIATKKVALATPGRKRDLRALLIGSVATHPEHRGRGHATALLQHTVGRARSEGLDLALLWSERWDLYRRLGFAPAGRQREVRLHFGDARRDPAVRPARVGDVPDLLALHEQKPMRVRRGLADRALLLAADKMDTMVLAEGGHLQAYACLGKGRDLGGWWHEFGGEDKDVRRLMMGAMAHLGRDTATALVPPYRTDLVPTTASSPTACALGLPLTPAGNGEFFVDGLDSI